MFSRSYKPDFIVVASVSLAILVVGLLSTSGIAAGRDQTNVPTLAPVGTGFTYQGYLDDGGVGANGLYDFEFRLYDASTAGNQIGSTVSLNAVSVVSGRFAVKLDFGTGAFGGGSRWLTISVRPSGGGGFTALSPRQELTPAPYAMALPNVYTNETSNFVGIGRDFRISSNEVFGIRFNGNPNQYGGMYVETSSAGGWPFYGYATNGSYHAWTFYNGTTGDWHLYNAGIRLSVPNEGGLRIGPSIGNSLVISSTTGIDGIQVGESPSEFSNYGLYIPPNPGVDYYGLWPNTADGAGQWALYTVDNIEAGNVLLNSLTILARVGGDSELVTGDVVAATDVSEAVPGAQDSLALVQVADASSSQGVIGVVKSRMVYGSAPGKEEEGAMSMHSADGPAKPGDYVSLVVLGVAQVKASPGARIVPGDRLTAADLPGFARPLQTRTVEGMIVSEGAPVLGVALAAPVEGQATIPVFVFLR